VFVPLSLSPRFVLMGREESLWNELIMNYDDLILDTGLLLSEKKNFDEDFCCRIRRRLEKKEKKIDEGYHKGEGEEGGMKES